MSEAKVNLEKAYEIGRRLTPDDPQLSLIVLGLAAGAWDDGDLDRAVELAEESLRMGRAGYGEDHPKTIDPLSSLADMKRMQGKKQEALNLYREAEKLGRETLGPKNLQTLYPRGRVCLLLAQIGARGEALEYCRSLASFLLEFEAEGVAGAGRVGLQRLLHLAWAFLELAAVEESLLWAAKAVEVSREVAGESSGAYAHAKVAQGRALALAGRLVEARDAVDFAIGMAEKITAGEAGDDLSDIWEGRAEVYVAAGEYDVALADYQEAIRRSGYEARIANYRAAVERLCREKNYEPACGAKSSR
ncbi:MAG: tetratricopeptide repeat protein [Myxococcota bacterium]